MPKIIYLLATRQCISTIKLILAQLLFFWKCNALLCLYYWNSTALFLAVIIININNARTINATWETKAVSANMQDNKFFQCSWNMSKLKELLQEHFVQDQTRQYKRTLYRKIDNVTTSFTMRVRELCYSEMSEFKTSHRQYIAIWLFTGEQNVGVHTVVTSFCSQCVKRCQVLYLLFKTTKLNHIDESDYLI